MTSSPPDDAADRARDNLQGMLWMTLSGAAGSTMQALVRHAAVDMHPVEMVFFRNLFAFAYLIPFFIRHGTRQLKTQRLGLHIIRGGFQAAAMILFWWALSLIPLAKATAILFSGPVFASIGAILILGEPSHARRWLAVAFGLIGMVIIIQPGSPEGLGLGAILAIVASLVFAASRLCVKVLSRTESNTTIVTYMALTTTPISLVPAFFVWTPPTLAVIAWLLVIAGLGTAAHFGMAQAYRKGEVTAVEGVAYTRLIWAAALGYFMFSEIPSIWTWAGSAVIIVSAWMLARGEARDSRQPAASD